MVMNVNGAHQKFRMERHGLDRILHTHTRVAKFVVLWYLPPSGKQTEKKDVGADIEIDTAPTDMSGRWMMRLLNLPTRQSSQNMTTDDGRFTKGPHRRFGEKV